MGNQQGKTGYSQNASGKPKKNVTWKSAGIKTISEN